MSEKYFSHYGEKTIMADVDVNGNSLELTISDDTVTAIGGKTVGGGGGSDIPDEGDVGQVLTKTQDGFDWKDATVPKGTFTTVPANVRTAYTSYIDVPSMPLKYNTTRGLLVLTGAFNVKSTFTASHQYDDDPDTAVESWTELIYWDLPQSIDTSLIERSLILGFSSSDPVTTRSLRLWVKSNDTHRLVLGINVGLVESRWYNIPDITKIL